MDSRDQGRGLLSETPAGLSRRDIESRLERQLDAGGRLTPILQDVPEGFEQCGNSWAIRLSEPEQGSVLLETRGLKTAIVEGLACRIAQAEVPASLRDTELLDVNLGILAAGASRMNEFEGRVAEILDRARDNPGLILFLDEMHLLRDARSDASQMMKADLGQGRIRCLGATTPGEYRAIEEDPALQRRFQKIPVLEPPPEVTARILRDTALRFEDQHGVSVPGELVGTTIALAGRFVRERRLPDSALDLLAGPWASDASSPTPYWVGSTPSWASGHSPSWPPGSWSSGIWRSSKRASPAVTPALSCA